jgi:hypothetical protein
MNKLAGNIHLCNIERIFLLPFKLLILVFIVTGLTQCTNPKGEEKKSVRKEKKSEEGSNRSQIMILPEDPFVFRIQFQQDTFYTFRLWFPELVIFDCDSSRAFIENVNKRDWIEKIQEGYLVTGKTSKNEMKIEFTYKITTFSLKAIKLDLEVKNTGRVPWSDYAQLAVCLAPACKNFSDTIGDRTFIHIAQNRFKSLVEAGIVHNFNHYPVSPRNDHFDPDQRIQVESGFVSRKSIDKVRVISFLWDKSARVDVNPGGLDCIHSHPAIGPLAPGEIIKRTGFIVLANSNTKQSFDFSKNLIDQSLIP